MSPARLCHVATAGLLAGAWLGLAVGAVGGDEPARGGLPAASGAPALAAGGGPSVLLAPSKVAEGAYPDLTVDRAGDVHVVYVRDGRLYYRRCKGGGRDWSAEEDTGLSADGAHRSDPEVAVDSQGRPHVLVGAAYA